MRKTIYILLFIVLPLNAQWRKDGIPIVDTVANRGVYFSSQIVKDGGGGAIICWQDGRSGSGYDIYAQRIDSNGVVQWQSNGIPICQSPLNQSYPRMISDGEGGAIIAWEDDRDTVRTRMFAQKVSHDGEIKWPLNGIRASNEGGLFVRPVSDGDGGVIMAWWSPDFVTNHERVICQRINKYGQKMWGEDGLLINSRFGVIPNNRVEITCDGEGGAIIAWVQANVVYVQKINSNGQIMWSPGGIIVSDFSSKKGPVYVIENEKKGAFLVWVEGTDTYDVKIFAQQIDSNGVFKWGTRGIRIQFGAGIRVTKDYNGGFVTLFAQTSEIHGRAQRVDSLGNFLWDSLGVIYLLVEGTNLGHSWHRIINKDKNGGVIIVWEMLTNRGPAIYSQAIDSFGNILWKPNGVPLAPTEPNQPAQSWPAATTDGNGGVIVVWQDWRSWMDTTTTRHTALFAQRVYSNGVVADVEKVENIPLLKKAILYQNYPNPFSAEGGSDSGGNPETTINYYIPKFGRVKVLIYDMLGQKVKTLIDKYQEEGEYKVNWNGINDLGIQVSSGIYFYQLRYENNLITKKLIIVR